ncbi:MAG: cytidylate kinase family protein [Spirochaetaceae bacterium]|jgi:cytidylate kinase|nr:cytidylate kinase family protein [Spirochaetaceae bacterium]
MLNSNAAPSPKREIRSGDSPFGDVKIAISGKSGCGNTTVSKMLAEKLGLAFINFTFRVLAEEKKMELSEILRRAETDDAWDREVDGRQVSLARAASGCVLGSRLAIWMLPEADLKVFLTARSETRVARILRREGGDARAVAEFTAKRDARDRERYIRLYGIDNNDYSFADLVIDTDDRDPAAVMVLIIRELEEKRSREQGRPAHDGR